ncbi:hypothetical protein HYC85_027745 [Camellia sinensis]|uniref:Leucine-rich repeat-containing N-terminal plant-type domain-containing protein n=1 Tax=Camellia sinensis TaxID=4442 RepID=A0A7J7FXA4_CAMSI|nr:hypothetical protein HYC85_027745 [Camellia sinensis]
MASKDFGSHPLSLYPQRIIEWKDHFLTKVRLTSFRHLEILNLSDNNFFAGWANRPMSTPTPSTGTLSSLKALSVAQNNLNGSLPIQGLCKRKKLEELDLNDNLFERILPPCLSNLRSLKFFDISLNQFTGNISPSLFGSLNSLESFANHSNLEVVDLISGNDKLKVEIEYKDWIPVLVLSNYNLNKLFGDVSKFLFYQNKLRLIDLSHNNLRGMLLKVVSHSHLVPDQLVRNYRYLRILKLANNNFCGQIFSVVFNLTHIWHLQLNDNQFTRPLTDVLSKLSDLNFLDISNNYMSSKITSSMDNIKLLETLILRNNSFNGQFPCALVPTLFNSSNLLTFDIRENNFSISIPDSIGVVSNLRILLLRGNQLSGSIPTQLCQLNRISLMDLSHNYFNGSIPHCFGNITFGMIGANLQGFMQMTAPLFNWHTFYKYRGFLERNFNIPLKNNLFANAIANEVEFVTKSRTYSYRIGSILNFMHGLDLSCNKLTGEIPFELRKPCSVLVLNLSHNLLTGPTTNTFSNLA